MLVFPAVTPSSCPADVPAVIPNLGAEHRVILTVMSCLSSHYLFSAHTDKRRTGSGDETYTVVFRKPTAIPWQARRPSQPVIPP